MFDLELVALGILVLDVVGTTLGSTPLPTDVQVFSRGIKNVPRGTLLVTMAKTPTETAFLGEARISSLDELLGVPDVLRVDNSAVVGLSTQVVG